MVLAESARGQISLPQSRREQAGRGERGSVTAEFALLIPAFILLMAAVLSILLAGVAQLQCIDAARAGARAAARHDDPRGAAQAVGPRGAVVEASERGDRVTVRVSAGIRLMLPGRPKTEVASESTAQVEPEVAP
ncbi:TadE family type IV pilus minor pilin [Kineosporia succinea]|uniref:Flp pilus assembly protein TadG n=1 Tax=Kineosporia succinea TaxID=84632 RepID=A0ABT9P1S0_9ACTN|nr:TadE family type IV pilus minor pilin [Kineosporia succinea]MDP9826040.1 Flp pilus assembly protein TadG [Kineosporia succinea]